MITPAEIDQLADAIVDRVAEKIGISEPERPEKKYMSREEAAHCLGISLATLDRQIASGRIRTKKCDRRVLIPADQL